jgi:hypothetical protein
MEDSIHIKRIHGKIIESNVNIDSIQHNFLLDIEKLSYKYGLPIFAVTDGEYLIINRENAEDITAARDLYVSWSKTQRSTLKEVLEKELRYVEDLKRKRDEEDEKHRSIAQDTKPQFFEELSSRDLKLIESYIKEKLRSATAFLSFPNDSIDEDASSDNIVTFPSEKYYRK